MSNKLNKLKMISCPLPTTVLWLKNNYVVFYLVLFNLIACGTKPTESIHASDTQTNPNREKIIYKHDPNKTEELRVREGLPNFFKKLQAGEDVKVGYIGGSITNGGMWRDKSIDWLKREYPKANITQINAAIGGKGPDFGACRIQEHLLVHNPDMVFIEFRVNNGGAFKGRALEGMIPQIWKHNPNIEICLVYTIAKWMKEEIAAGNQTGAGRYMEPVANHYGITSIDFGPEVMKLLKEDKLVFQKGDAPAEGKILFSKDGVHPLEAGHDIYMDVLGRSLKAIENHGTSGPKTIPAALYENPFSNAKLVPVNTAKFGDGWQKAQLSDLDINADLTDKNGNFKPLFQEAMETVKEGATLTVEWEGILLGLTLTQAPASLIEVEVSTDGGPTEKLDIFSGIEKKGAKYDFLKEVPDGKHITTIKLVKFDPSLAFQIGQFLVVKKS